MIEEIDDNFINEIVKHHEVKKCQCDECAKTKNRYIKILDVDRLMDNPNDWD